MAVVRVYWLARVARSAPAEWGGWPVVSGRTTMTASLQRTTRRPGAGRLGWGLGRYAQSNFTADLPPWARPWNLHPGRGLRLGLGSTRSSRRGARQPRSQHSRVGMLRQNNQHTPARAAVLAAVLSQPEWCFYNYE